MRFIVVSLLCAGVLAAAASAAVSYERVVFKSSSVTGSAVIDPAASGTRVTFDLRGLKPHAAVRAVMQAGNCKRHGASFASVGSARAGANGKAKWSARVKIAGDSVPWSTINDHGHVLSLIVNGRAVACAPVPGMS